MKYVHEWGYGNYLHWACSKCIVRAMCEEDKCYMTEYLHELCMDCKINHLCMMDNNCQKIKRYKFWESISNNYGDQICEYMNQHFKETSISYRIITSDIIKEKTFKWWTNGY